MIGVSLPLAYLAGYSEPASAMAWRKALGDAQTGLGALCDAGVSSIELRSIGRGTDAGLALAAARRVWDAGLTLTIHGHLPDPVSGATLAGICPSLAPLLEALAGRGAQSVMTLHGYTAAGSTSEEAAGRTAGALARMAAALQQEGIPLRIALENERLKSETGAGVTSRAVLGIIDRVDSPCIGACWDLGHAYANLQQGLLEETPNPAFLRRVIHTHIHDLGPRTHWPLTCGVVPVETWLDRLFAAGYAGLLNLELSPERFSDRPAGKLVFASIERLAAWCAARGPATQRP